MAYDSEKHRRRSIRLKGYDYAQAGAYFVTLVTQDRDCLFGGVADGKMRLNECGEIVNEAWKWLFRRYEYVDSDVSIVMPNHFHGIIVIHDTPGRGGSRTAPTTRLATQLLRTHHSQRTIVEPHPGIHLEQSPAMGI
jgi:putative transposase